MFVTAKSETAKNTMHRKDAPSSTSPRPCLESGTLASECHTRSLPTPHFRIKSLTIWGWYSTRLMLRVDKSKLEFFSSPSMIIARLSPTIFVSAAFTGAVLMVYRSPSLKALTSALHESTISRCCSCHFSESAVRSPRERTTINPNACANP